MKRRRAAKRRDVDAARDAMRRLAFEFWRDRYLRLGDARGVDHIWTMANALVRQKGQRARATRLKAKRERWLRDVENARGQSIEARVRAVAARSSGWSTLDPEEQRRRIAADVRRYYRARKNPAAPLRNP